MMAPWFSDAAGIAALPVGLAFGAALERAGLGSARTIGDQLRGRDFTVVKVMFSAIVTAMLGIYWASTLGWLDLGRVSIPETDLLPQAIGGVLFGAGFAVASLCPGTACVSAGTGRKDGALAVLGLFIGTLVVGLGWSLLGPVAEHAPREGATLAGDLGLAPGWVVGGLTVAGALVITLTPRLEGRPAGRAPGVFAAAVLPLGLLAVVTKEGPAVAAHRLDRIAAEIASEQDHVDPLQLAEWLKAGQAGLRVIDVRDGVSAEAYQIPGSETVPLERLGELNVEPEDIVVLYSDGGTHAAQGWVLLRARGARNVYVLRDGLAAWEDEVMTPSPPEHPDSASLARYRRARALSLWFGGRPSSTPRAPAGTTPTRRRNTC